jgi:YihY family inner membrane protein
VRVARRYGASDAGHWATNMAWNALFSFIPTLLLLATLVGMFFRNGRFEAYLTRQMAPLFHASVSQVASVFNDVRDKSWILALISAALLMWSGSSLFSCVDVGLSRLAGFEPRPFLPRRLRAMRMTLVFCGLLIPLLLSSALLSVPRGHVAALDALRGLGRPGLYVAQFILGTLMATALFAHIYRVTPNRGSLQSRRRVLRGAVSAGILLELLTLIFPLYIEAAESGGGALLLLALPLLLTYFYCVGNIVVIGHLVNLETGDPTAAPGAPANLPVPHV